MAISNIVYGDMELRDGSLICSKITYPAGQIYDAAIAAGAAIQASKLVHARSLDCVKFNPGTTIAAVTATVHIARAAGTLRGFEAVILQQATGADRTVTIDLQRSTGAGAFATVLSSTINITNTTAIRTVVPGSIATTAFVDNDIFQVVLTVAGVAGNQAAGLQVTLTLDENWS